MKHGLLYKSIIGTLVLSMGMGSFPASVGAWRLSRQLGDVYQASVASSLQHESSLQAEEPDKGSDSSEEGLAAASAGVPAPYEQAADPVDPVDMGVYANQGDAQPVMARTTLGDSAATGDTAADGADAACAQELSEASEESAAEGAASLPGATVVQEADGARGEIVVADRAVVDALGGRDFAGQVVKEIGGKKYILIGNEQQLRAIGSGKRAYTAVYQAIYVAFKGWEVDKDKDGNPIMLYGGDADLLASQNGKKDYTLGEIDKADGGALETVGRCGVNQNTGDIDPNMDIEDSGASYDADANYIIFRDIDLAGAAWKPLMFSGTMLGATAEAPQVVGSLWQRFDTSLPGVPAVSPAGRPVISNVEIVQKGELSIAEQSGVGFFGTISSNYHNESIFERPDRTTVRNIVLDGVKVDNGFTGVHVDETLVSALVGALGKLLGGLLDLILGPILALLGLPNLGKLVSNLLDIRKAAPDSLATGSFAGRVVGDVEIADCEVRNVSVASGHNYTGGFVGYVQGETIYGKISGLLKDLVTLLSGILNLVPGLGLGDVITLLLDSNIIDAKSLIPVDYLNPVLAGCAVRDFTRGESIGATDKDYAGGFAGSLTGSIAQGCTVSSVNPYTVRGRLYVGGFAGLMRNDIMKGALKEVGIELVRVAQPQSATFGCELSVDVTVEAASYAGGFAGAMANSYAVDTTMAGAMAVRATGHEENKNNVRSIKALAGGFTGIASVGWATDLGAAEDRNGDLLAGVNGLLTGLLTGDPEARQNLLSLVGVEESQILGVSMTGAYTVESANDYAGGLVGRGHGAVIAASDEAHLKDIRLWLHKTVAYQVTNSPVVLEGLRSVRAE